MPHLENWAVISIELHDEFKAPEQLSVHLTGQCSGHHNPELNGDIITTSAVISLDPLLKVAKTRSGSAYTLGEADPGFLKFLDSIGRNLSDYKFEQSEKKEEYPVAPSNEYLH